MPKFITVQICDECWNKRNPRREATRVKEPHREIDECFHCGNLTQSGIYIREEIKPS